MLCGNGAMCDEAVAAETSFVWGILRERAEVGPRVVIHAIEELGGDAHVMHARHHCCGAVKFETWNAYRTRAGGIDLRFACKTLPLGGWTDQEISQQAFDIERGDQPYWKREIRRAIETAHANIWG